MMLDRIFDWIDRGWGLIKPFYIVDAYELVGVLRFGKFHRDARPGFHWKIPLCEKPIETTACITTVRLPAQYLTTKDSVSVAIASIVKYQIVNIRPYITDIYDQHDVLCDVTMGSIRKLVAEANFDDLVTNPPERQIATMVRRAVNRYGFEIHDITFTSFTRARPIMLIQQTVFANLDN